MPPDVAGRPGGHPARRPGRGPSAGRPPTIAASMQAADRRDAGRDGIRARRSRSVVLRDRRDQEIYGPADDSFVAEMVTLAGGEPITTGSTTVYTIPLEKLVAADPEIILLGDAAYGVTAEGRRPAPGWGTIDGGEDRRDPPGRRRRHHPARAAPGRGPGGLAVAIHPSSGSSCFGRRSSAEPRRPAPAMRQRQGERRLGAGTGVRPGGVARLREPRRSRLAARRARPARARCRAGAGVGARHGRDPARRDGRDPRPPPPGPRTVGCDLAAGRGDDRHGPAPAARPDGDDRRAAGLAVAGRHVPGPAAQPAGRPVRARHGVRARPSARRSRSLLPVRTVILEFGLLQRASRSSARWCAVALVYRLARIELGRAD